MAKIQAQKEEKTYCNIYKEEWTQPWPMGSKNLPLGSWEPQGLL